VSDIHLEEVHLESSTYSDAGCIFCPQKDVKRKGQMSYDLMMKIVDEAVDLGCRVFTPFRANEPLQFPRLMEWLSYFRRKKAQGIIFTNANNLTLDIGDGLIKSEAVHSVTVSFHGGTPEIYKANMGLDFHKVRQNVLNFLAMKPPFPVNIFCMHRSSTVDGETAFMGMFGGVDGFASVGIRGAMEWTGDRPDSMTTIKEWEREGKEITRVPCSRILRQLDVAYNGDVCLCCVDAHAQINFGNLKEQSIEEIWNNRLRRWYVEQHEAGNFDLPLCNQCSMNIG